MIRVTVELLPYGRESDKRTLAVGEIANTGIGTSKSGYYRCRFGRVGTHSPLNGRSSEVVCFPRKRLNVWHLLARALRNADFGT